MMRRLSLVLFALCGICALSSRLASAQEASSGLDLRATLTGQIAASDELTEEPRSGAPLAGGSRSIAYTTWKFDDRFFFSGSVQLVTRPYYLEDLSTPGYGAKGNILQASLNYSRVSPKGSLLVRAGELTTAFGSFLLRYDDAVNPLIDLPLGYGYYYSPISMLPVAGAQVDVTRGKWDGRVQFANSSPANPRGPFASGQYGNWAGGAGYTIRHGLHVGASAYHGPYLDQSYRYYFPGEVSPSRLPARALGLDISWARGHTTVQGELQKFVMPYTVIPTFRETAGYGEICQVLAPRWFIAARFGASTTNATGKLQNLETSAAFRPNRFQLIKIGYELEHYGYGTHDNDQMLAIQLVTTLHKSVSRQ
jgi:hypothetical protein